MNFLQKIGCKTRSKSFSLGRSLFFITILCAGLSLTALPSHTLAAAPSFADPVIPDSLGINPFFGGKVRDDELNMISAAGFHWARLDLGWATSETAKGVYAFSGYDPLIAALTKRNIKIIFILDYSNPLYDDGQSPHSDEAVQAFANWSAAAVKYFSGHGFIFETYNEPNQSESWKPHANVDQYVKLANAVGAAVRQSSPNEILVGAATSFFDFKFLETCFQGGTLQYWNAVSLHPYRNEAPESVDRDYIKLRNLIDKYAPGKNIPIISSEWGYSTTVIDEPTQANYVVRFLLLNSANNVYPSIVYTWRDGPSPTYSQHHYGMVRNQYFVGRTPPYDTKPLYDAIKTFSTVLNGFHYTKRDTIGDGTYLLTFKNQAGGTILVAWAPAGDTQVDIPLGNGLYNIISENGTIISQPEATQSKLTLTIGAAPIYLVRRN